MKRFLLFLIAIILNGNALAGWMPIAENSRSIAYADTAIQRAGDMIHIWVMYDYKSTQESPISGRRYLSEKDQYEIDCKQERYRSLFATWHANQMGDGIVVYTHRKPGEWEPTSSPNSFANGFWQFVCTKN
jgi:hypothetical protein